MQRKYLIKLDQYKINYNKLLGAGAFAKIYLGTLDDRTVAIKQILKEDDDDVFSQEKEILEFITEINCKRPVTKGSRNVIAYEGYRIITVMYNGKSIQNYLLFLEYCNAGTLSEYIAKREIKIVNKPAYFWGQNEYDFVEDITKALIFLSNNNIVHCDVKDPNILLNQEQRLIAKLADFNLAKKIDDEISDQGSYDYNAPEILASERPHSAKSDMYSFGCVVYRLLTGRKLFIGSANEFVTDIKNGKRPQLPAECSLKLAKLVKFPWAQEMEKRPTPKEYLKLLEKTKNEIGKAPLSTTENSTILTDDMRTNITKQYVS